MACEVPANASEQHGTAQAALTGGSARGHRRSLHRWLQRQASLQPHPRRTHEQHAQPQADQEAHEQEENDA